MNLLEILLLVFALFALSRTILRIRSKEISKGEFLFWTVIWLSIIVASVFPGVVDFISKSVGVGQGTYVVVYVSIIALFYLVFRLYVTVDKQNKSITTLVRELSIKNAKKKK